MIVKTYYKPKKHYWSFNRSLKKIIISHEAQGFRASPLPWYSRHMLDDSWCCHSAFILCSSFPQYSHTTPSGYFFSLRCFALLLTWPWPACFLWIGSRLGLRLRARRLVLSRSRSSLWPPLSGCGLFLCVLLLLVPLRLSRLWRDRLRLRTRLSPWWWLARLATASPCLTGADDREFSFKVTGAAGFETFFEILEQALETLLAMLPLSAKVVSLWQDIRLLLTCLRQASALSSVHLQTLHLCKYMILKTGSHLCALVLAPAPAARHSCFWPAQQSGISWWMKTTNKIH